MPTPERLGDRSRASILTCLALTWLNPHVYLDTVLLLGSVGQQPGRSGRWLFGLGAATSSVVWFLALGYGARCCAACSPGPARGACSTA